MKYFEVSYPYYALIKAESLDDAKSEYIRSVADDDGNLVYNIVEVDSYYAVLKYGRGLSEDRKEIPIKALLEELSNPDISTLLIDGALL